MSTAAAPSVTPTRNGREDLTADVVIAGGGMVGLTLALALETSFDVVVVDALDPAQVTDAGFDGRVSAVAFASCRLLRAIGLWPHVATHAQPINDIVVSDGRRTSATDPGAAASTFLHFDHTEIGDEPLGHLIENRFIRSGQQEALAERAGIRLIAPAAVAAARPDDGGTTVVLADGRRIRAKLCLAADGRGSPLREAAGIKSIGWRYPQVGIVTTVEHERPHHGVAQEYFLPAGPFAILPMTGNRSSLVWTEREDLARTFLDLPDEAFAGQVAERFGPYLGKTRPVGPRWSYPLGLHLARSYVGPRLALVGDAAHGIHPIAGQGLNMGLRDVAALAEVLIEARRAGLDIGSDDVLRRYERWRRFDNVSLAAATDILNRLFSNAIGPLKTARNLGLGMVNRIGPARRLFMRHAGGAVAVGGEGNLPRLLRGKPV